MANMIVAWDVAYVRLLAGLAFLYALPVGVIIATRRIPKANLWLNTGILYLCAFSVLAVARSVAGQLRMVDDASLRANTTLGLLGLELRLVNSTVEKFDFMVGLAEHTRVRLYMDNTVGFLAKLDNIVHTAELVRPRQMLRDGIVLVTWLASMGIVCSLAVCLLRRRPRTVLWLTLNVGWILLGAMLIHTTNDVCSDFYGNVASIIGVDQDTPELQYYVGVPANSTDPYARERVDAGHLIQAIADLRTAALKFLDRFSFAAEFEKEVRAMPIGSLTASDLRALDRNNLPMIYSDLEDNLCGVLRAMGLFLYVAPVFVFYMV